jgi:hypothetical protein
MKLNEKTTYYKEIELYIFTFSHFQKSDFFVCKKTRLSVRVCLHKNEQI